MKIVTVLGARPQFIKAAAVSRRLREQTGVREILVHTGQHYDDNMSDVFFRELDLPAPAYDLGVGSGSHGSQTGRMLERIEEVLLKERPEIVLVYGDTNSTLAGALTAAKLHIPVAHVEAGLRSFNRMMPEEINRVIADHVSRWLFAPTHTAVENLAREGLTGERVALVGDVMYDVAIAVRDRVGSVDRWGLMPGQYLLATIHRAENTDDPNRLAAIFNGLTAASQRLPVVLPVHPRTRAAMKQADIGDAEKRLRLIDPVGFLDMVCLEKNARLIVTDSGGVQKEAFFHRVPCVTLRDETEWVELIELAWNRLVPPTAADAVCDGILAAIDVRGKEPPPSLYGGGRAAELITELLTQTRQSRARSEAK
jgi:UDP-GlcNAc3NAcA epimerase